jgi:hypothetical protein
VNILNEELGFVQTLNVQPFNYISCSLHLPGEATVMGFVPRAAFFPRVGATSGEVLVADIPIKPASTALSEYHPAIP